MDRFNATKPNKPRAVVTLSILALAIASNAWAYRVVEQLENAYELVLSDVRLPSGVTGSVDFRACDDCALLSLRVTHETTFYIDDIPMNLADFLEAAEIIRQTTNAKGDASVSVFFGIASQRVNRLKLYRY
jgi:hypothetical protein